MRKVVKEEEKNEQNDKYITKTRKEVIEDDGTVEKNVNIGPTGINANVSYTKGKSMNFHYETTNPDIVVPALAIFVVVFLLIGGIILYFAIKASNTFMIIWSILFIGGTLLCLFDNLRKHGKEWMEYFKNKRDK